MPTLQLPCVRCGRPVAAAVPLPLPTCARCRGGDTFEVQSGAGRVRLDAAAIHARLQAGTLAGTDTLVEDGVPVAIAAHPAFRARFLPGHPDAMAPIAAKASAAPAETTRAPGASEAAPGRGRVAAGGVALLVAAGVAAAVLWPREDAPPAPVAPPATVAAAVAPAVEAPPSPSNQPFDALLTRVGPVEEPRAALLAQAWSERNAATPAGLLAAVAAAEKAVARAPTDPEALALLAGLYAESGTEPELRKLLLERATAKAASAPVVRRAATLLAVADDRALDARPFADDCIRDAPADLLCREALAMALDAAALTPKPIDAENLLYSLDELARAWPDNGTLPVRAALLAARGDVVGAEARLAAAAKRLPDDPALLSARALLAFRNGVSAEGRALLAKLDAPSDALLTEAAGDAVGRSAPAEALALLARRKGEPTRDALLYEAQARLLAARSGKGTPAEALAAAEKLTGPHGDTPAAVQVRVAAAMLAGEKAAAARAWDALQTKGAPPYDVARAWLARASMDLADDHPREALLGVDAALQADRSDPEAFLLGAAAHVSAQNGPGAIEALRGAVAAIDGRHARRRPYGGALPSSANAEKLRADLKRLLGEDPGRQDDLALGLAVVAWLSGDASEAAAAVAPVAAKGSDADAFALQARLLLARGQAQAALAAADQALARKPKEVAWQLVRAEALLSAGRASEAESALALARSGNLPATSLQLVTARVAAKKGDTAAAIVARRAAAAADPADLVARRALRGVSED